MKKTFLLFIFTSLFCIAGLGQKNPSTLERKRVSKIVATATPESETATNDASTESASIVPGIRIPDRPMRIVSKPRAGWSDQSRGSCIQGAVILRIAFLSTGEVGRMSVVKRMPLGLVDKAIEAARKIQFEPAIREGKPVSITKQVDYSFSIY